MTTDNKGSVRRALEIARAKRLAALRPGGGSAAATRRLSDPADTGERTTPPSYVTVPFDPNECRENRILIGDTKRKSKTSADAAFRMLRTRILQRARPNNWTTIGLTSPGAGEGKSVMAINLALTISRERNNSVFLIDLDMRSPRICQYLSVVPPTSLSEYFARHAEIEDCLFSIGLDNLALAGNRQPIEQSSELLAGGRVERMFEHIRATAPDPIVIVDLPPLLSTDDALVVAPKIDACLLVVCEGKTRRDGAAKSLDLLAEYNLAGIVLTKSRATVSDYYATT